MNALFDKSISVRIAILCIIPLLALAGVGTKKLVDERKRANNALKVAQITALAPLISGLAHQLQKERGQSAGYISSKGKLFSGMKSGIHPATDKARTKLLEALKINADKLGFNRFQTPYGKMQTALRQLTSIRDEVGNLSLGVGQMASYYTSLIASLLSMTESIEEIANQKELLHSLAAYSALLQGKERAGLERAMGAAGFAAGRFEPKVYRNFVHFGAMQETYFNVFRKYAGKDHAKLLADVLTASDRGPYESMRQQALAAPFGGDISRTTSSDWFGVSTQRINALKEIEDRIDADIVAHALDVADKANRSFWQTFLVLAALLAFTIVVSVVIARSISRPITTLTANMRAIAGGNLSAAPTGQDRHDEIGEMACAVEIFRRNALRSKELEAEQEELKRRAEQEKAALMQQLADEFDARVGAIVGTVSSASAELQNTAQSMADISQQTSSQVTSASTASEQATSNVETVAAAAEEMTSTIQEISQQVGEASNVSRQAVEAVNKTGQQMEVLEKNATDIGEVIELISDIAEQTNLLALNATIESARAGDAGKGFAVVASEVKNLASQTTKATDRIARQIGDVQAASQQASHSMKEVGQTIEKVDEISSAIAAAMEEQSAATAEIANNVNQAASGTRMVNENITAVTEASQEAGAASGQVMTAASELSQQASLLRGEVDRFINQVRAG